MHIWRVNIIEMVIDRVKITIAIEQQGMWLYDWHINISP